MARRSAIGAAILALAIACTACTAGSRGESPPRGSPPGPASTGDAGPGVITVGSFDFPESVLLARLYAEALSARGYPVRVQADLGGRGAAARRVPALAAPAGVHPVPVVPGDRRRPDLRRPVPAAALWRTGHRPVGRLLRSVTGPARAHVLPRRRRLLCGRGRPAEGGGESRGGGG